MTTAPVTIRPAVESDRSALDRLAALDSARPLSGGCQEGGVLPLLDDGVLDVPTSAIR